MTDWKANKGLGPWAFTPQGNKWGYLNNPNWVNPATGPINYDAGGEPQVWPVVSTNIVRSRDGQVIHVPCGHWHREGNYTPTPPEPPTPTYIPWYSCPMMTIPLNNEGDVLFVTTDDKGNYVDGVYTPSTLYVFKYTSATDTWETLYSEELEGLGESILWNDWWEPDCFWAKNGSKIVFGLIRGYPDYDDGIGFYVFTYDGDTQVNKATINGGFDEPNGSFYGQTVQGEIALVDNLGYIHLILLASSGGVITIYDYRSTDDGATFTPIVIRSGQSATYKTYLRFIMQASNNTIYVIHDSGFFTSANNGATWSGIQSVNTIPMKVRLVNDIFISVRSVSPSLLIYTSTNCSSWTLRQTLTETINSHAISELFDGCNIAYDGTYYYIAMNFRNDTLGTPSPNGFTRIYRSSDATAWTVVGTVLDEKQALPPALGGYGPYPNLDISPTDGRLILSFYYNELESDEFPGVFFLTHWESSDQGVTWTPITSPLYDLSTGIAPS